MKSRVITVLLALTLIFTINLFASDLGLDIKGTKKFELNSSVSAPQLRFVSKAPLEDIKGTVQPSQVSSWVNIDPSNLEATTGVVAFQVKGMETGIKTRDGHLAGKEWLNADANPDITFTLQKLTDVKVESSEKSKGRAMVKANAIGTIKINGKTKNVTAPVSIRYIKESEETRKRSKGDLLSVEGKLDVNLKDFDVKGTKGTIGSRVGEVINTEFMLYYNAK